MCYDTEDIESVVAEELGDVEIHESIAYRHWYGEEA